MLFPAPFQKPILVPVHHEPYIFDEAPLTAMMLFNQTGAGLDCDLNPTDLVVADGVAWLDENGAEVRSWTVFDHPAEFPLDDFGPCGCQEGFWGAGTIDLTHANNVFPSPEGDAVIVSLRNLSRVVKIDPTTGEVLWQLGKGYDFTWVGDEPPGERWFNMQHDARYLPNGHITMFDNGNCRDGDGELYSRALELAVDEASMTAWLVWEHRVPYAAAMGNVVRLDNGGTFIAGGWNGQLLEVSPEDEEIWRIQYPSLFQLPNISHGLPIQAPWVYDSDAP
jgi:hypothetical protein